MPATVRADWETRGSGTAGWFLSSREFEPAPPVPIHVPFDSIPAAPIGIASTWFSFSLVMIYIALPFCAVAGAAADTSASHVSGIPATAVATRAKERSGVNRETSILISIGECNILNVKVRRMQ